MKRILRAFAVVLFLAAPALAADFVRQFPVERDTALRPGRYTFTFRLYDIASGGAPVFQERKTIVLSSPLLRHVLGSVNRSGMLGLDLSRQLYLEVSRSGSATPVIRREPFYVAPYAVRSETAGGVAPGSITGGMIAAGAVTEEKIGGTIGEAKLDAALARDTEILPAVLAGGGADSGLNADMVDGLHAADLGGGVVPIGAVIDWWRPNAGWPVPAGFAICDGSVVVDAGSPLNGVALPNLAGRFIMGVTGLGQIGATGGEAAHGHSVDLAHDHATVNSASGGGVSSNTGWAGDHNHRWSWGYNGDWQSWRAGGAGELMVIWNDGIGNDGAGNYLLGSASPDSGEWYTDVGGAHLHSLSVSAHAHSVDVAQLGTTTRSTTTGSSNPPYVGLLKIMRRR